MPALHAALGERYVFPYSQWSPDVQDQLKKAWSVYLTRGGLRDMVSEWQK